MADTEAVMQRYSVKKVFFEILQNSQESSARFSFLIKLQASFIKKRLWHRFFPVNFAKFQRHLFLQSTTGGCFYWQSLIQSNFKVTLMQIWKSAIIFVFIWKYYVEDFTLKPLLLFDTRTRDMWKVCLQTFTNNRIC